MLVTWYELPVCQELFCPFGKPGDRLIINTDNERCEMLVGVLDVQVRPMGKPLHEIIKLPEKHLLAELRAWKWYWRMTLVLIEARGKLEQRSLIVEGARL